MKIKSIKGFSSAYPNMCNLKLFPNVDGTWITIRDDVGTLMTVKLSDLNDFIHFAIDTFLLDPNTGEKLEQQPRIVTDKIRAEI